MHGYSEVLYAFTTSAANNGSAFAGLSGNTPWYNFATAIVILLGRYPPIIFMMAVAGSVAAKPTLPLTVGTLRTDTLGFGMFWLHHSGGRSLTFPLSCSDRSPVLRYEGGLIF